MIDVYIDDIKMKNCRGHYEMEMDFPVDNFTVIQGKNGAGKSTIPKSLSMGLFGDDGAPEGEKLTITEMVNRIKKKDLEIIINFRSIENDVIDRYRVELYYAHSKKQNKIFLFKNNIDISGETKSATYKIIESILYPKDVFFNVTYFSQQVKNFFTCLTSGKQNQIFDAILQTKEYSLYYKNTTAREGIVATEYKDIHDKLILKENSIEVHNEHLKNLEENKKKQEEIKLQKILDLKDQKIKLENQLEVISNELDENILDEDKIIKLESEKIKLSQKIEESDEQLKKEIDHIKQLNINRWNEIKSQSQLLFNENCKKLNDEYQSLISNLDNAKNNLYKTQSEISDKFKTDDISHELDEFKNDKRKEIDIINHEIRQLEQEFSSSKLDFEKEEQVQKYLRLSNDIKEKIQKFENKNAEMLSNIQQKQKEIREDKESLELDVSICSKCKRPFTDDDDKKIILDDISKKEQEIVELESSKSKIDSKLKELNNELSDIISKESEIKLEYQNKINDILVKKKEKLSHLQRKESLIKSEIVQAEEIFKTKFNKIIDDKRKALSEINSNIEKTENDISELLNKKIEKENELNTIHEKELENKKTEQIKKYEDSINDIKNKHEIELKDYKIKLEKCNKEYDYYNTIKFKNEELIENRKLLRFELDKIKNNIEELSNEQYSEEEIIKIKNVILELEKEISNIKEKQNKCEKELNILKFWKKAFSPSGIKSMLIDMAIPHMNEAVSDSLERIAPGLFTVSFDTLKENKSGEIKDKFNINILHNIKGTDSHKMLSGGEKRMVDLACMEALRSLTEKLYNKKIHNIFYDEVLDSLDPDNQQLFCQISKLLTEDKNVTLITHSIAENMEPDRIFKF